ncbi:MAG: hypothetical protein R6W72_12190 [Desulfurivibrionaceae bacterium]
MDTRILTPDKLEKDIDWEGNNVAFTCPVPDCGKVFIVSGMIHRGERKCPACQKSTGYVENGRLQGGKAYIQW